MAKVMKSYRFDESEVFEIRDISDALGLTETDVIRLALAAFQEYGIADCLADKLDNCPDDEWGRYAGYSGLENLVYRSARSGEVCETVRERMRHC